MLTTAIDIVRLKLTRRPPWSANEIAARQWAESKPLENDLTFIPETASFSRKTAASFMSPIATNFRKRPFRFLPTIAIRSRAGETSSDAGHPARPDRDASVGHVTTRNCFKRVQSGGRARCALRLALSAAVLALPSSDAAGTHGETNLEYHYYKMALSISQKLGCHAIFDESQSLISSPNISASRSSQ